MQYVDEWQRVFPLSDAAERELKRNAAVGTFAAASELPKLDAEVFREGLRVVAPDSLHFYVAEGYPWIKVGFAARDASALLRKFIDAGEAIQYASGPVQVYFHALRTTDILFFLNRCVARTKNDAELKPDRFGVPLAALVAPAS